MRRRDAAGNGQAVALGAADDLDRGLAGNLRDVIAPAGKFEQAQIALDDDGFGDGGDAGKAEAGCKFAFVHHAARERGFLRMLNDQRAEMRRIGHGAAHHLGACQRLVAIGEGDRACIAQQPDFSHLFAVEAFV